jgi:hypothetical protein
MALLSAGAAACLAPATSPFCIMGVQTRLLCILCCHAQVWQWAPAGPEDDNTSGWQHLRNHPHTAFYLSTGRNRGVEFRHSPGMLCPCLLYALFLLGHRDTLVGGRPTSGVEDDGLGFKVDSASMPEPRQWRSHAGGRFMQRARIISGAKLLW